MYIYILHVYVCNTCVYNCCSPWHDIPLHTTYICTVQASASGWSRFMWSPPWAAGTLRWGAHQGYWNHHDTFPEGVKNLLMVMNGKILENIGNIMGKWWETVDEWENSENIMLINGTPFNNEWFKGDHKKPHVKNLWRSAFQMNQLSQSFDMDELESMESMEWMFTPELEVDALPGWAMPAMFRSAPSGLFAVPLEVQPGLPRSPCSDSGWKQSGPSCSHVRREAIASKPAAWDGTGCPFWIVLVELGGQLGFLQWEERFQKGGKSKRFQES